MERNLAMRGSGGYPMLAASAEPVDEVVLDLAGLVLANGAATHRAAGLVHGLVAAGNQRMPPIEVAPLVDQAVGAGGGQPRQVADHVGGQRHAILDQRLAQGVVAAAAGRRVELAAGD